MDWKEKVRCQEKCSNVAGSFSTRQQSDFITNINESVTESGFRKKKKKNIQKDQKMKL